MLIFLKMGGVKEAAKSILSGKSSIDIIVNNIGSNYTQKGLAMMKMEEILQTLQINLVSHLQLTQVLQRGMKGGGSIIFMSSAAAFDGGGNVAYVSSKAALCGAVRRLAIEYNRNDIRVNAIAPGLTDTDMIQTLTEEDENVAFDLQIMKRKGRPEEIADVAVFLGSSMSSYMTGQVIHVDGGVR